VPFSLVFLRIFADPVDVQEAGTFTRSDKAVMVLWGMEIWKASGV
jgi:hypothetical protein